MTGPDVDDPLSWGSETSLSEANLAELIGLDDVSYLIYRTLLANPSLRAPEVAEKLNLDEELVCRTITMLADQTMVYSTTEADVVPLHPDVGIGARLHQRESELRAQQMQLAAARAAVADLSMVYTDARKRTAEMIGLELLEGIGTIRARLAEMAERANFEVLTFAPGGKHSPESLEASRPLDERTLQRSVRVRTVYLDSIRNDRVTTEYVNWLAEMGAEVRTIHTLPVRMLIADRSVALLPVDPENSRRGAVILRANGAITALVSLFEAVWEKSTPIGSHARVPIDGPSPQDLELLKLLAAGLTDEMAGRRMGLSLRTVRRLMAEIMKKLGARSRFEAGILASHNGWL
jgi:DNA-binding CsgD family transcriptional regulator/sugar-specific transcriptional regulator TrmB